MTIQKKIIVCGHVFHQTSFEISRRNISKTFLQYHSSKTIREQLQTRWYYGVATKEKVKKEYSRFLDEEINVLMKHLVASGDKFYREFLNKCGDKKFCEFRLTDKQVYKKRGLYLYTLDGNPVYVGRCIDNFISRFNRNYGKISPKNCYKGGRSTNTHINSLVNFHADKIGIYLCVLSDEEKIIQVEKLLRGKLQLEWNRCK